MNNTWRNILIGLAIAILSPLMGMWGNSLIGFFSTPKEVREINHRITVDSTIGSKQLRDSCFMFRGIILNQHNRVSEIEQRILNINRKLKLK